MSKGFNYRPFVVLAVLLAGWHWALGLHHVESDTLAPPGKVVAELGRLILDGTVLVAARQTLLATLLGLAAGSFLGTLIGLISGLAQPVALAIRGPVEVLRPLPAIALVPLMTITFGLGLAMEVYVIIFAVIWPCIILTQSAVRAVDPRLLEVADVLELSWLARVWKIVLPSVRPRLIVMLRFVGAIALLIAVTVELVSNPWGLGHQMMIAEEGFHPDRMLAYLVVITLMGWCLNWAFVALERHAFTPRLNAN
ncbi:MAG: ABC transporter permease subunit [Rhodobacteraceae bacterium]|nr:ABC transporter permease subunit [Paracoccaceae bacterium]